MSIPIPSLRRLLVSATAVSVAVIALALVNAKASAPPPQEHERALVALQQERSTALTVAAPLEDLNAGRFLATSDDLHATLQSLKQQVPLPAGGSLDDIDLEAAAEQGGASTADLTFVAQHNAQCDWYSAVANGDTSPATLQVVEQIPRWSAFRKQQSGAKAAEVAAAVVRGDLAPLRTLITYNCGPSVPRG